MLWALQAMEIEPITSAELHLRLDQCLQASRHVGGLPEGPPPHEV